jgi:F0F1-type ATP synthase membrane subunit b/b'
MKGCNMARKIFSSTLIVLSSTLLILSILGIALAWVYNEPLTKTATFRLQEVDSQLTQIQTDLRNAKAEVERALRIIQSAEDALASLTQQTTDAKTLLEDVNATLDDELIPGLETTRTSITEVRGTLEDLRGALEQINSLPFIDLNIPGDELLVSIIAQVDELDSGIADVQDLAQRASTFISDTSYLLGGDFNETKQQLEELVVVLTDYDQKTTDWREQIATLIESSPRWIDNASLSLTLGLLWFAFSQFGLILHGLGMKRGINPLDVWRETFRRSSKD